MERLEESATVVVSGSYERRRGYLTAAMYTVNQVAVTTTVAIWAYLIRWDLILKQVQPDWALFATEAAWAGALSSIVVGVWRLYERQLDQEVVRLYPGIYLCERLVLPAEVCVVNPPKGVAALSKAAILDGFDFRDIPNTEHGGRGHNFEDLIGAISIVVFSIMSLGAGWKANVIALPRVGWPHQIGLMLIGNLVGLALIVTAYMRWRKKEQSNGQFRQLLLGLNKRPNTAY